MRWCKYITPEGWASLTATSDWLRAAVHRLWGTGCTCAEGTGTDGEEVDNGVEVGLREHGEVREHFFGADFTVGISGASVPSTSAQVTERAAESRSTHTSWRS